MDLIEKKILGYQCARCELVVETASVWEEDYPEGYYLTVRRVTEAQNHYLSDDVFLCSKACLVDFIQYGVAHATREWRPITRVEMKKRASDRRTRSFGNVTREQQVLGKLPARSSGPGVPIDPDHVPHPMGSGQEDSAWCEQHQRYEQRDTQVEDRVLGD